ncbi:MAG: DnaD domain protein [Chloroflexota bacterium]
MTNKFKGFSPDREQFTRIPDSFFTDLLPEIDSLGELKLTLYIFWRLGKTEGEYPYISKSDFLADETLVDAIGGEKELITALDKSVGRRSLLTAQADQHQLYFLNNPLGQSSIEALEAGHWEYSGSSEFPIKLSVHRPNVFNLYENNIGPITPMIAETLKESEEQYPVVWIEDAINIAVINNVRKWPYVEAILKNWQEEGKDDETDKRRGKQAEEKYNPEKYTKGKFSGFIKS